MSPQLVHQFSKSARYNDSYPGVGFGLALISGCRNSANPTGFDQHKRKLLRRMRKRETLARITARIDVYDRFFHSFGYECPLTRHLQRTVQSGFPRYDLIVDGHFLAEMCAGILVAVTDADRFEGQLTLDVADYGESCHGMGGRFFELQKNEIVLRDEKEIVCVLCQGADEKTRVRGATTRVLYYAFAVPGIDQAYLKDGLTIAAEALAEFGEGRVDAIEVY